MTATNLGTLQSDDGPETKNHPEQGATSKPHHRANSDAVLALVRQAATTLNEAHPSASVNRPNPWSFDRSWRIRASGIAWPCVETTFTRAFTSPSHPTDPSSSATRRPHRRGIRLYVWTPALGFLAQRGSGTVVTDPPDRLPAFVRHHGPGCVRDTPRVRDRRCRT